MVHDDRPLDGLLRADARAGDARLSGALYKRRSPAAKALPPPTRRNSSRGGRAHVRVLDAPGGRASCAVGRAACITPATCGVRTTCSCGARRTAAAPRRRARWRLFSPPAHLARVDAASSAAILCAVMRDGAASAAAAPRRATASVAAARDAFGRRSSCVRALSTICRGVGGSSVARDHARHAGGRTRAARDASRGHRRSHLGDAGELEDAQNAGTRGILEQSCIALRRRDLLYAPLLVGARARPCEWPTGQRSGGKGTAALLRRRQAARCDSESSSRARGPPRRTRCARSSMLLVVSSGERADLVDAQDQSARYEAKLAPAPRAQVHFDVMYSRHHP